MLLNLQHQITKQAAQDQEDAATAGARPPTASPNVKTPPKTKARSQMVLTLNVKSLGAAANSRILNFLNERKEHLDTVVREVEESGNNILEDDKKEEISSLVKSAREAHEDLRKKAEVEIAKFHQEAKTEQEYEAAEKLISGVGKMFSGGKQGCKEVTTLKDKCHEIRTRSHALVKFAKEMQNNQSAKSAQELRGSQASHARREFSIISKLRHHVQAKADRFEPVNVSTVIASFWAELKGLPVQLPSAVYKAGVADKLAEMKYFEDHCEWVKAYVAKHGITQAAISSRFFVFIANRRVGVYNHIIDLRPIARW